MTDLRTAAQQALEAMEGGADSWQLVGPAIDALRAALAKARKAEPAWVCPDSAEHRYQKPGHCEDCGKTLVQVAEPVQQGCDHCNHPLYAAIKCRVCGRVTEPVQEQQCNPHPKAPHGFLRNASHTEDRYVCECEYWDPYQAGYQAGMEAAHGIGEST